MKYKDFYKEFLKKPRKFIVYHGTGIEFNRFSLSNSAQGIIWFSSNKDKVLRGEVGSSRRGFIITAEVTINNPAGWEEYEKMGLGELKREGFDGAILPDSSDEFTCFLYSTQNK